MDINSLIFEAMILEASQRVKKLTHSGKSVDEAIVETVAEFELTSAEACALTERAKKLVKTVESDPVDASVDAEGGLTSNASAAPAVSGCSLHFGSEDDLDQATGILMYKGIDWKNKIKGAGQFLIEFDDQSKLEAAQGVLKRRFDFVEAAPRRVGVVEFDNLADYSKVLEFMKRQSMMIECREGITLDEDAELQEAVGAEAGEIAPVSRSFAARPRGANTIAEMDIFSEKAARSVVVRKRWK